jgi:SAM-dependent methyltransferase
MTETRTTDALTIQAYDQDPASFAADWETQPAGTDLHQLVREYFDEGPTADVGCGSGRDTAWLAAAGFDATGYDASAGLIAEARRRHPGIRFETAALPELDGVGAASFANVLCETVIMHLPPALIGASVRRLAGLLRPAGTLYLTWRVTAGADHRDQHGRLYAAFDPALVSDALTGSIILVDEQRTSDSSGKTIHRVIARAAG